MNERDLFPMHCANATHEIISDWLSPKKKRNEKLFLEQKASIQEYQSKSRI